MELIRGFHNLLPQHRNCVATIGNFDGIHRGHEAVIAKLRAKAQALDLPAVVITFEPHPKEFFMGERAPARLSRLRDKLTILNRYDIDRLLCLHFNRYLAEESPEDFIQRLLIDGLQIQHLIVGDDFRFGYKRAGNFELLQQVGLDKGFGVEHLPTILHDDTRISSTWVRQALKEGDLALATTLLGRPYHITGRVAHGDKRGRTIGFPTANIHLLREVSPILGVFAVRVYDRYQNTYDGVANVGHRPTVNGTQDQLEVHLFDFDKDIYDEYLRVEFVEKIRDEQKFASFDQLKQQIILDADKARDILRETR